jgi:hypothetical protein
MLRLLLGLMLLMLLFGLPLMLLGLMLLTAPS